jgi:hypothetical protein
LKCSFSSFSSSVSWLFVELSLQEFERPEQTCSSAILVLLTIPLTCRWDIETKGGRGGVCVNITQNTIRTKTIWRKRVTLLSVYLTSYCCFVFLPLGILLHNYQILFGFYQGTILVIKFWNRKASFKENLYFRNFTRNCDVVQYSSDMSEIFRFPKERVSKGDIFRCRKCRVFLFSFENLSLFHKKIEPVDQCSAWYINSDVIHGDGVLVWVKEAIDKVSLMNNIL